MWCGGRESNRTISLRIVRFLEKMGTDLRRAVVASDLWFPWLIARPDCPGLRRSRSRRLGAVNQARLLCTLITRQLAQLAQPRKMLSYRTVVG